MSVAILDTLHDMPRRVPNRDRSGVMLANAAEGSVTRAAEKKPVKRQHLGPCSSRLFGAMKTYPIVC